MRQKILNHFRNSVIRFALTYLGVFLITVSAEAGPSAQAELTEPCVSNLGLFYKKVNQQLTSQTNRISKHLNSIGALGIGIGAATALSAYQAQLIVQNVVLKAALNKAATAEKVMATFKEFHLNFASLAAEKTEFADYSRIFENASNAYFSPYGGGSAASDSYYADQIRESKYWKDIAAKRIERFTERLKYNYGLTEEEINVIVNSRVLTFRGIGIFDESHSLKLAEAGVLDIAAVRNFREANLAAKIAANEIKYSRFLSEFLKGVKFVGMGVTAGSSVIEILGMTGCSRQAGTPWGTVGKTIAQKFPLFAFSDANAWKNVLVKQGYGYSLLDRSDWTKANGDKNYEGEPIPARTLQCESFLADRKEVEAMAETAVEQLERDFEIRAMRLSRPELFYGSETSLREDSILYPAPVAAEGTFVANTYQRDLVAEQRVWVDNWALPSK